MLPKTTDASSGVRASRISLGGGSNSRSWRRNLSTGGSGSGSGGGADEGDEATPVGAPFSVFLLTLAFFRCAKGDSSPPPPPNIPDIDVVGIMNDSPPKPEDEDDGDGALAPPWPVMTAGDPKRPPDPKPFPLFRNSRLAPPLLPPPSPPPSPSPPLSPLDNSSVNRETSSKPMA